MSPATPRPGLHVVAGAGPVGSATAALLAEQGAQVRLISRSGRGPEHPAIERVPADAGDAKRMRTLGADAVAIYNCLNPAYHQWPTDWPPMHDALVAAAEASGAVLAITDNLYAYGPPSGPMVEGTPDRPKGHKAAVRAKMWADALARHQAGTLRAVDVRSADYVGPGAESPIGERVVPRVLVGKGVKVIGKIDQPRTYTYIGDVARMLVAAAADESAWGRVWHTPSNAPRTQKQAIDDIARVAGVAPVSVGTLPPLLLRVLGLFNPTIRELDEVLYQFDRPFVMDSSAATAAFDLQPTPWDEVIAAHIEPFRTAGH